MDDGAIWSMNICWALPEVWPGSVYGIEIGIVGDKGVIDIEDTHRDLVLASEIAQGAGYSPDGFAPGAPRHVDFLTSYPPGDLHMGQLWGPMREETNSWYHRVATGQADAACDRRRRPPQPAPDARDGPVGAARPAPVASRRNGGADGGVNAILPRLETGASPFLCHRRKAAAKTGRDERVDPAVQTARPSHGSRTAPDGASDDNGTRGASSSRARNSAAS